MRSKAIFMALLALAFGAQAEPVSQSDAASVASAWMQRNVRHHGRGKFRPMRVRKAMTHKTSDGTEFHSFRMQGGGTVITSADTEDAPVIAFTPKNLDLSATDRKSPLWALLNRDLSLRGKGHRRQNGASERHRRRWSELRRQGSAVRVMAAASFAEEEEGEGEGDFEPSDMRVPVLLKTAWGQSTAYTNESFDCEVDCFNSQTPAVKITSGSEVTYENCLCGCVATAMAQLMKFWEWPKAINGFDNHLYTDSSWPVEIKRTVSGDRITVWAPPKHVLSADAGQYDWAGMTDYPLSPVGMNEEGEFVWAGEAVTESNCLAIGKLTYDCGVAVGMAWGLDSSGLRSDRAHRIPEALVTKFGYKHALLCEGATLSSTTDAKLRANAICANLDAGHPVLLLVSGGLGGHAVVGDGYGFTGTEETPYVHLNMGWDGQNDVWYNLPLINVGDNPESFDGFDVIDGVVYNVYPDRASGEIVSGHVTRNGASAEEIPVSLYADGELVGSTQTSSNGVYSFFVESGKAYTVRASVGNVSAEAITPVIVSSTSDAVGTIGKVGNSWATTFRLTIRRCASATGSTLRRTRRSIPRRTAPWSRSSCRRS